MPLDTDPGVWIHRIDGFVQACTQEDAVSRAETVLEEFLGACMVLGITSTFHPPRTMTISAPRQIVIHPASAEGLLYLDVGLSVLTSTTAFKLPQDLSDIEERALRSGADAEVTKRHVSVLISLFSGVGDGVLSVRTALRFFCRGVAAREYGLAVFNWFTALEGVLLDPESKADVQSRLVEAVSFSLETGIERRAALRKDLKQLYEDRSRFVHTGRAT